MRLARFASLALLCIVVLGGCGGCGGSKAPAKTGGPATSSPPATAAGASSNGARPASREVSPGVVQASFEGVSATMHAGGRHPHVNRPWPVSFSVSRAGKPAKAAVSYEYLFAGQVVARRSHYRFTGSFHDTFLWPASALGYPLTFRAVIASGKVTLNLDYAVQVVR